MNVHKDPSFKYKIYYYNLKKYIIYIFIKNNNKINKYIFNVDRLSTKTRYIK